MTILSRVRNRINNSPQLQAIIANTGWLFFDRMFRMGVGVFVGAWVARYLGPDRFGLLNYAMSITAIAGSISTLGLDSIVVRELIHNDNKKDELLGTCLGLRFLSSLAAFLLNIVVVTMFMKESGEVQVLVLVLALGFFFQAFDTFDYRFQAKIKSRYSVVARNAAFFVISIIKVVAILLHASLWYFALFATVEIFLGAIGLVIAYRRHGDSIQSLSFSWTTARSFLRDSWPLTLSSVAIILYMRIDQVLVGKMVNASAVGIYAAAVKIVEVWHFVPGIITISIFPAILQVRNRDHALYLRRIQQLYDLMVFLSVGLSLVITLFSSRIMTLLYGEQYIGGAAVLTIYVWSGIGTFLGIASSQFLVAENLTKISLYRTLLGMIVNIVLNVLLIPHYGITGSALATLFSYVITTFSLVLFSETRLQASMMMKSLFRFPTIFLAK